MSILHAAYRGGISRPSPFIADIPVENRIVGWLHGEKSATADDFRAERKRRTGTEMDRLLGGLCR